MCCTRPPLGYGSHVHSPPALSGSRRPRHHGNPLCAVRTLGRDPGIHRGAQPQLGYPGKRRLTRERPAVSRPSAPSRSLRRRPRRSLAKHPRHGPPDHVDGGRVRPRRLQHLLAPRPAQRIQRPFAGTAGSRWTCNGGPQLGQQRPSLRGFPRHTRSSHCAVDRFQRTRRAADRHNPRRETDPCFR